MKAHKLFLTLAVIIAISAVAAPETGANCGTNKYFRSAGAETEPNVRVTPAFAGQGASNAIGRWWDSADANLSSNFGENSGTCDSSNWWKLGSLGNLRVEGVLDDPTLGCVGYEGCPGLEMTVVVEDYGPSGPPGSGERAYYVGFRVDDTPATLRRYNYGRTSHAASGNHLVPFLPFPDVVVTSSARRGNGLIALAYDLHDQTDHVHTAAGEANSALPTDSVVREWHLMKHLGRLDPGREREHWTQIDAIPYQDGGTSTFAEVFCGSEVDDEYLAIGIGFDGGAAGIIDSVLVGRAIHLECSPNIARPEGPTAVKPDTLQEADPRPRGRGR